MTEDPAFKQQLFLLLLEVAAVIADPVNGLEDEAKAADLTARLLEAVKQLSGHHLS